MILAYPEQRSLVYPLVKPFLELALFRRKPQDLPQSLLLLWVVLAAHALMGFAFFMQRIGAFEALLAGMCGTTLLALLTASLLALNGLRARIVRTLTALAGIDLVIGVVALPVSIWLHLGLDGGAVDGLASLLFLLLLAWNLGAAGHVLRHALSAPLAMGVVIALIFYVVSESVLTRLFPGPV
jgi:hypothetical protein